MKYLEWRHSRSSADVHGDAGTQVAAFGTSLLLLGFGLGPLLWAPLSEVYGRKPAILIPTFLSALFAFVSSILADEIAHH